MVAVRRQLVQTKIPAAQKIPEISSSILVRELIVTPHSENPGLFSFSSFSRPCGNPAEWGKSELGFKTMLAKASPSWFTHILTSCSQNSKLSEIQGFEGSGLVKKGSNSAYISKYDRKLKQIQGLWYICFYDDILTWDAYWLLALCEGNPLVTSELKAHLAKQ